jgi:hypothetical protein
VISDHIGLSVSDCERSKQFFATALAAGGSDNGSPGIREIYHPNCHGRFVIASDGRNVETVCRNPEK